MLFLPLGYNVDSDVGIIKLLSPLSFNSNVGPACLPSEDFYPENEGKYIAITSGWGILKERKMFLNYDNLSFISQLIQEKVLYFFGKA